MSDRRDLRATESKQATVEGIASSHGSSADSRFWRDASGRLTFDCSRVEEVDYPVICRKIADAFALSPVGDALIGPQEMFWDFRRDNQIVELDWNFWMRFTVVAKSETSEPLVQEIAGWLNSNVARGSEK